MTLLRIIFFSLLVSTGSLLALEGYQDPLTDYNFQKERMLLSPDSVIVFSSFENQDVIAAYTYQGINLWEARYHAKIISWEMTGNYIFVFSKDRGGQRTYLTCMNRHTGDRIWQRP